MAIAQLAPTSINLKDWDLTFLFMYNPQVASFGNIPEGVCTNSPPSQGLYFHMIRTKDLPLEDIHIHNLFLFSDQQMLVVSFC